MEIVLSQENKILFFNDCHSIGITTSLLGDFNSNGAASQAKIQEFQEMIGASRYIKMIPKHEDGIIFEKSRVPESRSEPGDAIVYKPRSQLFAIAHCSYITLSKKIIEKLFKCIKNTNGLKAVIYGGICKKCYEVDLVIKNLFPEYGLFFENNRNNHFLMDLSGIIWRKLVDCGIAETNIDFINICSHHGILDQETDVQENHLLYSYRRNKEMERNLIFYYTKQYGAILCGPTGNCPYVIIY